MFEIEYDQIPRSEALDVFNTLSDVIDFAKDQLNGIYLDHMTYRQVMTEMDKNGYYLNKVSPYR